MLGKSDNKIIIIVWHVGFPLLYCWLFKCLPECFPKMIIFVNIDNYMENNSLYNLKVKGRLQRNYGGIEWTRENVTQRCHQNVSQ